VTHFHHSPLATNELVKRQKQMKPNDDAKKLIQHCKTRWNSAYNMMERLVELRWPVVAVLSDRDIVKQADAKTLDLKEDQWDLIKKCQCCSRFKLLQLSCQRRPVRLHPSAFQ